MANKPDPAITIQRKYYTDTASRYDHMHAHEGGADASITKFMYALLRLHEIRTILDVGTATGTGIRDLKQALPDVFVCGVEPVAALVDQAVLSGNIASGPIIQATGEALPFADASFDAVLLMQVLSAARDWRRLITEAGREPVERDTLYRPVTRTETSFTVSV